MLYCEVLLYLLSSYVCLIKMQCVTSGFVLLHLLGGCKTNQEVAWPATGQEVALGSTDG